MTKRSRRNYWLCLLIAVAGLFFLFFTAEAFVNKTILALISYDMGLGIGIATLDWFKSSMFIACFKCQKKINYRSKFCNFCGEKLEVKK